jgi:hypothetical protein
LRPQSAAYGQKTGPDFGSKDLAVFVTLAATAIADPLDARNTLIFWRQAHLASSDPHFLVFFQYLLSSVPEPQGYFRPGQTVDYCMPAL